jgi:Photosystem I psaA/psaB protein
VDCRNSVATQLPSHCPACRNSIAQLVATQLPSLSQLNCPVIAQRIAQSLPSELPSCRNSIAQLSQLCRNSLPTRCPANCPTRSALPHRRLACGLSDGFLLDLGNGGVRLPTKLPGCRNVTAIWMGFCIDKFLVQVGQRWVPKSRTKLTRTLWYTLGTAHDFESKRLQSARSFFISVFAAHQAQLAIIFLWSAIPLVQIAWQGDFEQWVSNPRGHPHRALDKRSSLRSSGRLGLWSTDREHNRPVRVVLHHRPEDI